MVYCGECGEQNPDGGKYCWKCGKPLYLGTEVHSGEHNQSTEEPPGVLQDDIEREVARSRAVKKNDSDLSLSAQTVADRAAARTKSYTGVSIAVFILYWVFWLPGLVLNILYFKQAKRMEKTAEQSLPGVGWLSFMLKLQVAALVALMVMVFVIAILALLGPQIANIFSKVETSATIATPAPSAYSALATPTFWPTLTRAAPTLAITTVYGSKLLLTDNFVDNRNGWDTREGAMYFEDRYYHVRANREGFTSRATCRSCGPFTDFDYSAMIEKIEGPDDAGYGLVFRTTKDGFYIFEVAGDGWYAFSIYYRGEWYWDEKSLPVPSDSINKGNSKNLLEVICRGSRFEFYINDRFVDSVTNETFSSGYVGVGVGTFGQHIRVSSVVVRE